LQVLLGTGYSLLITPVSLNAVQTSSWPTPEQHLQSTRNPNRPAGL